MADLYMVSQCISPQGCKIGNILGFEAVTELQLSTFYGYDTMIMNHIVHSGLMRRHA